MSKGNLFLGMGRGSVGDVTLYRMNGEQIARARNRHPNNPQTALQLLQRIILATAGKAYSLLQNICDHSFQNQQVGTGSQARFMTVNVAQLRNQLAALIADPTEENIMGSTVGNFVFKGGFAAVFNPYIVSEGTLPRIAVAAPSAIARPEFSVGSSITATDNNPLNITYADVAAALNAQQGDQITLLALSHDYGTMQETPSVFAFEYARIILEPSSGNMSTPFLTQPEGSATLVVNLPNEKNEGDVAFLWSSGGALRVAQVGTLTSEGVGTSRWIAALAAILSRREGDTWARSSAQFVMHEIADEALNWGDIGEAYASYFNAPSTSPLYLNQSGSF